MTSTNQTVTDQKIREQAINPRHSFIIRAPAGSGKTGLLILRYLKLLALAGTPEEVVAVTFTRKAVAEMRTRVIKTLNEAKDCTTSEDAHKQQTLKLAQAVLKRNKDKEWHLLENSTRLRIMTIDGLCNSIARQLPLLSGMGVPLEITDNAEALYEQAAEDTLWTLQTNPNYQHETETLLLHIDNDLLRIKRLIVSMLKKREQWIEHIMSFNKEDLEQGLRRVVTDKLTLVAQLFPAEKTAELCRLLKYATNQLATKENQSNPILACQNMGTLPSADSPKALAIWLGIAELLTTQKNQWRKSLTKKNGFPTGGLGEKKMVCQEMKDFALILLDSLRDDEALKEALISVKQLPDPEYNEETWKMIETLVTCLKIAEACLQVCFVQMGQIDHAGIAQAAIKALGTPEQPTDMALYLDHQIKHLLIDEFQDISMTQKDLFELLVAEWNNDDGRTVFLVGDPMQSIYRFRQAEVGIFLDTYQTQLLGEVKLQALSLQVNFRSVPAVVGWVNDCFSQIMASLEEPNMGTIHYTEATPNLSVQGEVKTCPLINATHEEQATTVIKEITTLREKYTEKAEIAILVRNRSHLQKLIPLLNQHKMTFEAQEIESLGNKPVVQDLLALTRAYLHNGDRAAWLSVLRAPWCGLTLKELLDIAEATHDKTTIWDALNEEEFIERLDTITQSRLQSLLSAFQTIFSHRRPYTLCQAVKALWIRLGGPAALSEAIDLEHAYTFFERLQTADRGGRIQSMEQFIEQIESLYALPKANPYLKLMTIHKAKGLEFDHVIVPSLDRPPRQDDKKILAWTIHTGEDRKDLILAPILDTGGRGKERGIYQYINFLEKQRTDSEVKRLMYVATTRARHSLCLIGNAKLKEGGSVDTPKKATLLFKVWPVIKTEFEGVTIPSNFGHSKESVISNRWHRINDWHMPNPLAFEVNNRNTDTGGEYIDNADTSQIIEYDWAGDLIRRMGTVVHLILKHIGDQGLETWSIDKIRANHENFKKLLYQYAVPERDIKKCIEWVSKALVNALKDKRGRWILSPDHIESYNDYPVSGIYQGQLVNAVIDRTFVDKENNICWIVDYKISQHSGGNLDAFLDLEESRYHDQLEKYVTLMRGMCQREVRAGLYFPLLQGWREWKEV